MTFKQKFLLTCIFVVLFLFCCASKTEGLPMENNIHYYINVEIELYKLTEYHLDQDLSLLKMKNYDYEEAKDKFISYIIENDEYIDVFLFDIAEVYYTTDNIILKNIIISDIMPTLNDYMMYEYRRKPSQYLEGYGYTDPNFIYKYGKELGVEPVSRFWKVEKRVIENEKTHEFYIKSELVSSVSQSSGLSGNIESFNVTGEAKYMINGKLENFSRCEIKFKERIETRNMLLYEKRRVEVELLRAPRGFFTWFMNGMNFNFEVVGSCYKYIEVFAETELIIEPEIIINL